ncbi:MAG: DMT family transporter [Chloroflexaceae bacterium]|nr:DMT family transporter [Chloroflexaceae bacterium]
MPQRAWLPFLVLAGGVLIASTSAIMIRFAQNTGMPSLTIAAGRMLVAALVLLPLAWLRVGDELRRLQPRQIGWGLLSGVCLALHFAAWISSLAYTSVASSVALVSTGPLWIALLSFLLFREQPGAVALGGIALTVMGSILIGVSDAAVRTGSYPQATLGNLLAVLGALTVSGYLLIGRNLRRTLSLLAYIWLVYTSAAVILLAWVLVQGVPLFGFALIAYLSIIGLAIGPQLLGHTSFNWALRYLSATFIAVAVLGEPIGSAGLAWLIFGEGFAPLQLGGFVLVLAGIYFASQMERPRDPPPPSETLVSTPAEP